MRGMGVARMEVEGVMEAVEVGMEEVGEVLGEVAEEEEAALEGEVVGLGRGGKKSLVVCLSVLSTALASFTSAAWSEFSASQLYRNIRLRKLANDGSYHTNSP